LTGKNAAIFLVLDRSLDQGGLWSVETHLSAIKNGYEFWFRETENYQKIT